MWGQLVELWIFRLVAIFVFSIPLNWFVDLFLTISMLIKSPQGWLPLYTGLTVDNNGRDVDEQERCSVEDVEKNAKSKAKLSKENTNLTSVVNQTNSHFFPLFSSDSFNILGVSWEIFVIACSSIYWPGELAVRKLCYSYIHCQTQRLVVRAVDLSFVNILKPLCLNLRVKNRHCCSFATPYV